MSTIQDHIQHLATTYQESEIVSKLTEKDLLGSLALNKSMSHERCEMQCMYEQHDAYKRDPDEFIDRELGPFRSRKRVYYDMQAQYLYRLAQRYRDTQEHDEPAHPFHQEMTSMKARFAACLPLISDDPDTELSPEERESFRSELSLCLAYGKQLPQKSDAIRYLKPSPFHDEQGLGVFYQQLISNRRAPESVRPSIEIQIHDATMALRASPFYQGATPAMQRTIQHVAEDLINGVDPEHSNVAFASAFLGFGLVGDIVALVLLKASELSVISVLGIAGGVGVVSSFVIYAAFDYSTHAGSARIRMYDYPPIECDGVTFGENIALDQQCFGMTRFDSIDGRRVPQYYRY